MHIAPYVINNLKSSKIRVLNKSRDYWPYFFLYTVKTIEANAHLCLDAAN
jgi:hypothetical protein